MSNFIKTNEPDTATGQLKKTYQMVENMFQMVQG